MPSSSSAAMRTQIAAIAPAETPANRPSSREQPLGPDDRVAVRDHDLPVEHREVDDRRDEAVVERAQALDELALHRLGGDDLGLRVVLLQPPADAHQRAAGAEPGDERGHLVELVEDLDRGAVVVGARVGLVAVLVGHVVGGVGLGHLERQLDRAVRALGALGVDDLGAEHAQQLGALLGDVVGHHDLQRVALAAADHRQRDAGVAGGRLEDRLAGLDRALGLGGLDHRLRDPVLDRAGRVAALELGEDPHAGLRRQPRQLDQRRVADRLDHVAVAAAAGAVERRVQHRFRECGRPPARAPARPPPSRPGWGCMFPAERPGGPGIFDTRGSNERNSALAADGGHRALGQRHSRSRAAAATTMMTTGATRPPRRAARISG